MVGGKLKVVNGEHSEIVNAASLFTNNDKIESLSEKYTSELNFQTKGEMEKENHEHQESISECKAPTLRENRGESEPFSEKYTSEVSVETVEEAEQENSDQIRQKVNDEKDHGKTDEYFKPGKNKTAFLSSIDTSTLKKQIEQMTLHMARYVPSSNLLASVAGKLKKMYEI